MRVGGWQFRPGLWPTLAVVALLPLLLWLGTWQVDRAAAKAALEAEYVSRGEAPALSLDAASDLDLDVVHYRRISASGRFVGERQFLMDNRTHRGVAGYHVLTLLEPETPGMSLVVNRGWVPVGMSRAVLPAIAAPEGNHRVAGTAIRPSAGGILLGETGYAGDDWPRVVQTLDLEAIAAAAGRTVLPFVLLLDADSPDGFARTWRAHYGISPDRHRGYALQWYSLALALVVIYVVVNTRRNTRS